MAKKTFWSDGAFPNDFFQCFKGVCKGGIVMGVVKDSPELSGNYTVIQECGEGAACVQFVGPAVLSCCICRCQRQDVRWLQIRLSEGRQTVLLSRTHQESLLC